jgi:arylsulfatase A-like enzyme
MVALVFGTTSLNGEEKPNVIIVMTDDQGYGDLSCHGNPVVQTPSLDSLHAESVRLTDFHVAPMCTPTRGQLLTGTDAFYNGAVNVSSGRTLLRSGIPTMADIFVSSGYSTGIFGKWHLGDNYPFRPHDRGFQEAIWFPSSHINSVPDFWDNDYFNDTYRHNDGKQQFEGYCTDVFFSEAIRWIRQRADQDEPFFVYLPLNSPHSPLYVPDHYRGPIREALAGQLQKFPNLDPKRRDMLVSFLAMIVNIDENMGRLDRFLDDAGLRDDTLLIFLTDNGSTMGPHYFNAGMKGGKVTLWEGGHRVPCFLRWPNGNLIKSTDINELTHVQDLLPTLIDLCGLTAPGGTRQDGVSLAGLLRGSVERLGDRMLVVNYSRMPWETKRPTAINRATPRREGAAVLWKNWRLLEDSQLYNLESDYHQDRNVIDQFPEVAAKMSVHLDAWWDGVKEDVNRPARVVIGHPGENPMLLTACEWFDVFIDLQKQVRQGLLKNGIWHLEVAHPGMYEFELRRWPREADQPLSAGVPETQVTDGILEEGKALPIRGARIRIGGQTQFRMTADADKAVVFRIELSSGPAELQTAFLTTDEEELCGAYCVYVKRIE